MSMLWLTTALGVLMLLSLAVIAGILLLGTLVCLLSRGLDLLLATDAQAVDGVLYVGNARKRLLANAVYTLLNEAGSRDRAFWACLAAAFSTDW